MGEENCVLKSYITGPRWAKFQQFLRDRCFMLDLNLEMNIDKGWIRETVQFKIDGPKSGVKRVAHEINISVDNYNR